jgi:hypothetical protein
MGFCGLGRQPVPGVSLPLARRSSVEGWHSGLIAFAVALCQVLMAVVHSPLDSETVCSGQSSGRVGCSRPDDKVFEDQRFLADENSACGFH